MINKRNKEEEEEEEQAATRADKEVVLGTNTISRTDGSCVKVCKSFCYCWAKQKQQDKSLYLPISSEKGNIRR